jgi:thiamine biosynthesis lipoprotein
VNILEKRAGIFSTHPSPPSISRGRLFFGLAAAMIIALQGGCTRAPDRTYKTQFFTLGTIVDISLWDVDRPLAAEAVKAVENVLNDIHRRYHAWEPSDLTRLNAGLAAGETVTVTDEEARFLDQSRALAIESEELFNPAIGKLIGLWGFHSSDAPTGPPPPQSEIDKLLSAHPSMEDLEIDGNRIGSRNPAVELDVGAIAKGYAVDLAIEALQRMGIRNAIVNAGGGLRAIGRHGDRPWKIGIRNPVQANGIIASIETQGDESVQTSGNYERYYDYQGRRYHHIIDPRNGYPAAPAIATTVIHKNGAVADAASTALMIAGPEKWLEIARKMGISQAMLIDADMKVHMTPEMAKRVHFEVSPAPQVIIAQ